MEGVSDTHAAHQPFVDSVDPTAELDALAERASGGDRSAWAQVWRELSGRIHAYLRVAGAGDPEGLTSDVFVALIGREAPISGGWAGLRSLAFSMAHARMVDDRRKAAVRKGGTTYTPESDPRSAPSAEAAALASTGEGEVTALLDLLPEDERAVLTLRYVADLDLAGTAEALGRSKTTVSRLQARALATLRGFLDHSPLGDDATEGVS